MSSLINLKIQTTSRNTKSYISPARPQQRSRGWFPIADLKLTALCSVSVRCPLPHPGSVRHFKTPIPRLPREMGLMLASRNEPFRYLLEIPPLALSFGFQDNINGGRMSSRKEWHRQSRHSSDSSRGSLINMGTPPEWVKRPSLPRSSYFPTSLSTAVLVHCIPAQWLPGSN